MCGEPSHLTAPAPFRLCGSCRRQWASWNDFVIDPELRLLGLQAVPSLPDGNLLVFDHCCGTSISLLVSCVRPYLADLGEEAPTAVRVGLEECRRNCPELEELAACARPCVQARDRRVVQAILQLKQGAK
jgi:hypothetical protein